MSSGNGGSWCWPRRAGAAYDRVALSSYVDSWDAEALALPAVHDDRVELRLGDPAVRIDRRERVVRTASGREIAYDALVLATGSAPFVPPVPGTDQPGCFVYRTIEDLDAIRAAAQRAMQTTARPAFRAVIGGGLLGLEAAKALRQLGLETHVVEFAPRLMPRRSTRAAAALLRRDHRGSRACGSTCGKTRRSSNPATGRMLAGFADGGELDIDMVVFSAGIRPRDELARACGLAGRRARRRRRRRPLPHLPTRTSSPSARSPVSRAA